jgi:hypothetical protein
VSSTSPNGVGLLEFGLALQLEDVFEVVSFQPVVNFEPKFNLFIEWENEHILCGFDTIKELMSYPKYRSVKVINNPVRMRSIHRDANYINYK